MTYKMYHSTLKFIAAATSLLLTASPAWSTSYKILHSFSGQLASNPSSGLVLDKAGNAYGTTSAGGFNKAGAVYQLSPKTGFHVIYGFSGPDGRQPQGNLAVDADGNLYGTTVYGGANQSGCNNKGCGTVFRLSPPVHGGAWTQTVLYSFGGGDDGSNPQAGVILDPFGNLFGTTKFGGDNGKGTVFELSPGQGGIWTETVILQVFEGEDPTGLVFDDAGNLFGTTGAGGPQGGGTVYELSPGPGGVWTYSLIYAFNGFNGSQDAAGPGSGLIFDAAGNLFGTAVGGGQFGIGSVFELTPNGGQWKETVIYSFAGGSDGATPMSGAVFGNGGRLYGTTFAGGTTGGSACLGNGCGTIYELTPSQSGEWTERRFAFPKNGSLGIQPAAPLLLGNGSFYGTNTLSGPLGGGVIFRIGP